MWEIFCSIKRHVRHAWNGCGGADAAQSSAFVYLNLRNDSRQLSSYQMAQVVKNIAKHHWQILISFSSSEFPSTGLFLKSVHMKRQDELIFESIQ